MNLADIPHRCIPAIPWVEGENIPWNDKEFSARMLSEHLNQEHNLASRRSDIIDLQVRWIHEEILERSPTRILDLACGPGLYTSRLAKLGHQCLGIDFAPAAIDYAKQTAREQRLTCEYRLSDVREADYGEGFGLVMMLFGQINVFKSEHARSIIRKANAALASGGKILLEPQRLSTVESTGRNPSSWQAYGDSGGLFSPRPHICLTENFWDDHLLAATQRFYVVDTINHEVAPYAMTTKGYTNDQFESILMDSGFTGIRFEPSLTGVYEETHSPENQVVLATKASACGMKKAGQR